MLVLALIIIPFAAIFVSPADAEVSNWQKGASIVPTSPTDFSSSSFQQSVQNLKNDGANYVSLIVPYYQSNQGSIDIGAGWNTPTDAALISAINYAHSVGLKVMLKPHVELYSNAWRAYINPGDRDGWFAAYGNILNHLADIGKQTGAEEICIGAELISLATFTSNSNNTERWVSLINDVRSRYDGLLTYSANWGKDGFEEEVSDIGFWPNLDYIGISAYYELGWDTNVSALTSAWSGWDESRIKPLADKYGKPILFTEIGYRSVSGATAHPWDSASGGSYDPTAQENSFEALFQYWNSKPYFTGLHMWHWSSDPNYGGEGNIDYTPRGKPAENTIRNWFGSAPDEATTTPEVIATTTPEVIATTTPEIIATTTPEVIATTTPEVIATTTPEVIATTTPEIVTPPVSTTTPDPVDMSSLHQRISDLTDRINRLFERIELLSSRR